jgi:dipeptidase E
MGGGRATRRIVALGGHEFRVSDPELAILDHVLSLTGADAPRVCLLPTAGGDERDGIAAFYRAMDRFGCRASHLSLFRLESERVEPRRQLLDQDLIYVAGGSLLNLLAIWRAHGIPAVLTEAWRSGVVLCGQSAGALCWFEQGITASAGRPRTARGLGLVRGSLCVHYARDPARRMTYLERVAGGMPDGWGLDDGAGICFESGSPPILLAGKPLARVVRVEARDGIAVETVAEPRLLTYRRAEAPDPALEERRALRLAGVIGSRPRVTLRRD